MECDVKVMGPKCMLGHSACEQTKNGKSSSNFFSYLFISNGIHTHSISSEKIKETTMTILTL